MIINFKAEFVFFAMTKTRSTAIEKALHPYADIKFDGPPNIRHINVSRFEMHILPYLKTLRRDDLIRYAVIRHPLEWLSSWYRYRARPEILHHKNSTANVDFEIFVNAYLDNDRPPFANLSSPRQFLLGVDQKIGVDRLFRYEAVNELANELGSMLGVCLDISQRDNVSPLRDTPLSTATIKRLENSMSEDMELYENAVTQSVHV